VKESQWKAPFIFRKNEAHGGLRARGIEDTRVVEERQDGWFAKLASGLISLLRQDCERRMKNVSSSSKEIFKWVEEESRKPE
jgi:hypothetical protein